MEIYVFDKKLNFLGIVEKYFSLIWIRRYNNCGEFELHCSTDSDNLELLKINNIIWKKKDEEAAYIEYVNILKDNLGKEKLILKGKFISGYLNRRIIWSIETINSTVEKAIRYLIEKHAINPINKDRIVPLLKLSNLKNYKEKINCQVSYKNLLDEINRLSFTYELGYKTILNLEEKVFLFDIYKGVDRSIGQKENYQVIISQEFENVLEEELVISTDNYKNLVLVAGQGEGIKREFVSIGYAKELDRYELFVDARDIEKKDKNDKEINIEKYKELLIERGNQKLSEYKKINTFDSRINLSSNLTYKKSFDLGDIVTCISKKWNVTVNTRITEIEEIYEEKGLKINIIFGNNIPNLIDKIKREVR